MSRRRLVMEGLEQRQLLAGDLETDIKYLTGYFTSQQERADYVATVSDRLDVLRDNRTFLMGARGGGAGSTPTNPRNLSELPGNNDSTGTAQPLTLGTAPGNDPSITLSGSYSPLVDQNGFSRLNDLDYYQLTLRGGDILSARISGGTNLMLYDGNDLYRNDGDLLMFSQQDQGRLSYDSPLLFGGDANLSYVIPKTGTYYIATNGSFGQYVMDLRVFRPTFESEEIGTSQILYLDFDGELLLPNEQPFFTQNGPTYLEALSEFMPNFGFRDSDANAMIDLIIENVVDKFNQVGIHATNGWYPQSGNAGEYGIQVLNSRDHGDLWGLPNVMRVIVGGGDDDSGGGLYGLAEHVDVGNFVREDTAVVYVEPFTQSVPTVPRAPTVTDVQIASWSIGNVVAHEAGHLLGLWHTIATAQTLDIIATTYPDDIATDSGDGRDGIVGTDDDQFPQFLENRLDVNAAAVDGGYVSSRDWLAWVLATGKVGGTISGSVFNDLNRNGVRSSNEVGLGGITVFSDRDGDGVFDANEPSAVTASDGSYSLLVSPGQHRVRAILPAGYVSSNTNPQTVTVATNGGATATFGATRVSSDVTGFKWNDINGNGVRDTGEPGLAGVYIYLDLDGDDRLDLGEPRAVTAADGSYSINFPGAGTYTIREVVAPGYAQTFPASGEHIVVYNGSLLTDNYNFGNRSVQDFGDAPNTGLFSFPTTGTNAAVAGIVAGLSIGATVDSEIGGLPTLGADGDDLDGSDDEDGVSQTAPLSPGGTTRFSVDVTNTTGTSAYLSAWIDLNGDGDWADAGEKFASDIVVSTSGSVTLPPLTVPLTTPLGSTYARFRLSQSPGVGAGGFTAGGEVEDYRFFVAETAELANDDNLTIDFDITTYDGSGIVIPVLANDFDVPSANLTIDPVVDTTGTKGQVLVLSGGRELRYYPDLSNPFGLDSFVYFVNNGADDAKVTLDVRFRPTKPIAVDDSFDVQQGVASQPLNVLQNDIQSSAAGGLRIVGATSGSEGGSTSITSGGQSIRYTPRLGFVGSEQFQYSIVDGNGNPSEVATVTVHVGGSATGDRLLKFDVQTLAADGVTPINTVRAGDEFKLRVLVDDLRDLPLSIEGVGAAYLDLLYTSELVGLVPPLSGGSGFDFDVSFGTPFTANQGGDGSIPGIVDEIGASQSGRVNFTDSRELFTITFVAKTPGVASFVTDPADGENSDISLWDYFVPGTEILQELTFDQITFGTSELTIIPGDGDFAFAVDDSYPDKLDSNGNLIQAGSAATLDVLENDLLGPSGIEELRIATQPTSGTLSVNLNGTPNDASDDYLVYTPRIGFSGIDQFSYSFVTNDQVETRAEVTVTVGNAEANDDVEIILNVLDLDGNVVDATNTLSVGEQFNVQVFVKDLRDPVAGAARGVFAAYMDLLYNSTLAEPAAPAAGNDAGNRLGFQVTFGDNFDDETAVGDNFVPGLINEFGTFQTTAQGSGDPLQSDPVLLATITMVALAPGSLRLVADPADVSPFQDTLLFDPPNVVPISEIRYDVANVTITSGGEGESPFQNARNRMDVNNDGAVSPIDALLVLNRLNSGGGEGEGPAGGDGSGVFWDVNGDKKMTPIDALQVINYLNRSLSGSGEGEAAPLASSGSSSAAGFASAADAFFGEIGGGEGEDLLVGGSTAGGANGSRLSGDLIGPSEDDDDRDDADGLTMLAGE